MPDDLRVGRQSAGDFVQRRDRFVISCDRSRLDVQMITRFFNHDSYWATDRTIDTVRRSIEGSICFGLYDGDPRDGGQQVGFARVVTDGATFGWLCDVFVLSSRRGLGLGKWLVEVVVSHPKVAAVRVLMLATRDAHELYRQYGGFEALPTPERWMRRRATP
jgi:GNAT superfamily N-acetyltransferase